MRVIRHLPVVAAALTAALVAIPASSAEAASSIAILPFNYSRRVRSNVTVVRKGRNGSVWVLTTKDKITVEFETDAFTNKFITALVNERKFEVVERQKLDKLLDEQKLSKAGLVDPARAVQMGKLLGADYFVMAEISVFNVEASYKYFAPLERYKRVGSVNLIVDMRVVDTKTGKIVCAEKGSVIKDITTKATLRSPVAVTVTPSSMDEIQREMCKQLVRKLVDGVFPIKVIKYRRGVAYLNRGAGTGIAVGQQYTAFEQGEALVDEDTGLTLGAEEEQVAVIRVDEVLKKYSKGSVVSWIGGRSDLPRGAICRPFTGKITAPPPPPRDTTPPSVKFLAPGEGQTINVNPVNVVVEVPDGDVTRVVINGVAAVAIGKGRYRAAVSCREGANRVTAEAFDAAGNRGTALRSFRFDSTPPEVSGRVTVVVRGKVDDPSSTVTVNGQRVTVGADGSYSVEVKLGADRSVVIIATDEFGNAKRVVKRY